MSGGGCISCPWTTEGSTLSRAHRLIHRMATGPQVEIFRHQSSHNNLRTMVYGVWLPVRIRSDSGPQFRGQFEAWAKLEKIVHELTSPFNHQENGAAECALREMKKLLEKTGTNSRWH